MLPYNEMINKKLEDLEDKFTLQINQVENQVSELQVQQLELAKAIAKLSRITANLANRQQRFETYILAFNEQLLKQQIVTTRRSIENRKLILSRNAHETQMAIKEYNARKLILQALKNLKNISSLRNDTVYRNQIQNGIIHNTEIYRIIKKDEQNLTRWNTNHPLKVRNQSQRIDQFHEKRKILQKENKYSENIKILQEWATITIKPIEIIEFTNKYDPILFLGADMGLGISSVIKSASDTGIKALEAGTTLVKDVVDKGLNVLSEPIKIVIITARIIGGMILLLIPYKYLHKEKYEPANINLTTAVHSHTHIWKHHDTYYKEMKSINWSLIAETIPLEIQIALGYHAKHHNYHQSTRFTTIPRGHQNKDGF